MEIDDFAVGDKVVVEDGGQELNGNVESIQINKNLIDVKIYEPGNRNHCLIKSYPAEALTVVDEHEPHGASSYAELQKAVEGRESLLPSDAEMKQMIKAFMEKQAAGVQAIDDSLAALTARVEALESKKKDEANQDQPLPGDSAASA